MEDYVYKDAVMKMMMFTPNMQPKPEGTSLNALRLLPQMK